MRGDRIRRIRDYQTQNNHDYEPQDRYRDSRGREHYNNGRYAPRNDYRDEYTDYYDDRRRIGFSYDPRMGESYGGEYDRGYAGGYDRMTRAMADEWLRGLENEDGSRGAHWDYFKVAKKFNVNNTELYADLAEAFLCDKGADEDKLVRYYECIVE